MSIQHVCERYEPRICGQCGVKYYVNPWYSGFQPSQKCDHSYPVDAWYPEYYIYYAGVNGYIALYADAPELLTFKYGIYNDDEVLATNNLHEAKTKRKL